MKCARLGHWHIQHPSGSWSIGGRRNEVRPLRALTQYQWIHRRRINRVEMKCARLGHWHNIMTTSLKEKLKVEMKCARLGHWHADMLHFISYTFNVEMKWARLGHWHTKSLVITVRCFSCRNEVRPFRALTHNGVNLFHVVFPVEMKCARLGHWHPFIGDR